MDRETLALFLAFSATFGVSVIVGLIVGRWVEIHGDLKKMLEEK